MNMNKPTLEEKNQAIESILSEGLQQPEGIRDFFTRMYRTFGLKHLFFNVHQSIAIALLIVAGVVLMLSVNMSHSGYATVFLVSPLFFVLVVSLTEWMEQKDTLYELKRTFKYTVKDMAIFRTLCYSLISVFLSVILSLIYSKRLDSLRTLAIAFSALFLCTLLTIVITRRFNHRYSYLTSFSMWGLVNVVPVLLLGKRWEVFLSRIPLSLTLLVSVGLIYLYIKELKQIIHMKDREVGYDVAG